MQKRTREIIALIMLVVLGIAGVCAMAWYILVGHNWNAAATNIDERIGSMEGYTVVLCTGSAPTLAAQREASISQPMLEEQNFGAFGDSKALEEEEAIADLASALASYAGKGAQIVRIDLNDPGFYADPIIVSRNGMRFAIFSASGPRADLVAHYKAKRLERYNIDFTICIIDDLEAVERGLGAINLAICTDLDAAGNEGRYIDRTYVVGVPYKGDLGAIVMAPSGFLSMKTVDDV